MMSHERLDVYQLAIKFVVVARRIIRKLPRGNADLADHLRRAARAQPLLIAEGVGKVSPRYKAQLFADARGEAFECAAALDVMWHEQLVEAADFEDGKHLLEREVGMLTRLCHKEP